MEQFQVYANDFGSPQMYSNASITFFPVTVTREFLSICFTNVQTFLRELNRLVSAVRNLRSNVASDRYQIFEWDEPEYGSPTRYRLVVRRGPTLLAEQEIPTSPRRAITKVYIQLSSRAFSRFSSGSNRFWMGRNVFRDGNRRVRRDSIRADFIQYR